GRLAGTGGSRHADQAARLVGNPLEHVTHAKLLHAQHGGGNGTEHCSGTAVLYEGVDPETRQARYLEGEVGLKVGLVTLALLVVHDPVDQAVHRLVIHRLDVDTADFAVDADQGRHARRDVQVRRLLLDAEVKQFLDVHAGSLPPCI